MKNQKPLRKTEDPNFAKDSFELLKKISETADEQQKLFEIVKKLSEYYMKGRERDEYSSETH